MHACEASGPRVAAVVHIRLWRTRFSGPAAKPRAGQGRLHHRGEVAWALFLLPNTLPLEAAAVWDAASICHRYARVICCLRPEAMVDRRRRLARNRAILASVPASPKADSRFALPGAVLTCSSRSFPGPSDLVSPPARRTLGNHATQLLMLSRLRDGQTSCRRF